MTQNQKMIPLDSIKLNERNPRQMSDFHLDVLCESIKRDPQFMDLRPIVVDEQNIILGGNQRYKACLKLDMKEVPASWIRKATDLTEEQRKRFILVDNSPEGMSGVWDFDILLKDYEIPSLEEIGFKFPEGIDANKEWEGMPEFQQEDKLGISIKINFDSMDDKLAFAKVVDQTITEKTDSIWWPKKERRDLKSLGYETDSGEDEANES